MFQIKVVDKIKTHISFTITFFFLKFYCFWDNLEKFGRAGQVTDDSIIWRMCIAGWILKATNTHS